MEEWDSGETVRTMEAWKQQIYIFQQDPTIECIKTQPEPVHQVTSMSTMSASLTPRHPFVHSDRLLRICMRQTTSITH